MVDNDQPGRDHVAKVARSLRGKASRIRLVELPGLPDKGDLTDWIAAGHTAEELMRLVEAAQPWGTEPSAKPVSPSPLEVNAEPKKTDERRTQATTLIEIATRKGIELFHAPDGTPYADTISEMMDHGLSDAEVRVEIGCLMPETIDAEIAQARRKWEGERTRLRAHAKTAERGPPPNEPTDGAALLDKVCAFLRRFVVYPSEHVLFAHVLWIVHTHAMPAFDGSGKTRALEVTEPLVPNPVEAINVTPAHLFRKVGSADGPPTLLFDEIDTVFGPKAKDNEEIRGLLNAGHRKGATAGRCVVRGKTIETEEIPAYCAVALAGLGALPDTISSRAVIARMRRRAPDEVVEAWRRRIHAPEGKV